jgi:hypothetical protein
MQRQSEADFAPSSVGSTLRLLSLLRTRITQQDLSALSREAEFQLPNNFDVQLIEQVLQSTEFPVSH